MIKTLILAREAQLSHLPLKLIRHSPLLPRPLSFYIKGLLGCLGLCLLASLTQADDSQDKKAALGQRLFFDTILSLSNSQSCASCHDPSQGFVDKRENGVQSAASLGHDGKSLGDRNAPSAAYANQIPAFHQRADGEYIGGMFWDGREPDLASQAGGPPLNPIEMAMPDKQMIAERLAGDVSYRQSFQSLYGDTIFESPEQVYQALKDSIAAFEQTEFFSPFDSKYDRYLKGDYQLTEQEELGMTLFFSKQFSNCNECHQLNKRPLSAQETFSDYRFHNIGVPVNRALRTANNSPANHIDQGLLNNPLVDDPQQKGKFKTPTLRNVAITGPYMHNGVFQELKTVVAFYNQYNSKNPKSKINPETGQPWKSPEVTETIALDLLKKGAALDEQRIDAIVAFLKLLTDKRYESIIR